MWADFYKNLIKTSQKDENGMFHGNIKDIHDFFKNNGYHVYDLGGQQIYSKTELTPEEKAKYKKEYDDNIEVASNHIAEEIDKGIISKLIEEHPEYCYA